MVPVRPTGVLGPYGVKWSTPVSLSSSWKYFRVVPVRPTGVLGPYGGNGVDYACKLRWSNE